MSLGVYDPKRLLVIVGTIPITGFVDGEFVSVSKNEEAWSYTAGADGGGTRTRMRRPDGRITLTLQAVNASNASLNALAQADELTPGGLPYPIQINDLLIGSLASAPTAWCVKIPDLVRGNEAPTVEWVFETDNLIISHGGTAIVNPI